MPKLTLSIELPEELCAELTSLTENSDRNILELLLHPSDRNRVSMSPTISDFNAVTIETTKETWFEVEQ